MNFLKCEHCGFLNEVKSEHLTFCANCNKKLKNNFREWQLRHDRRSFIEFINENCISDKRLDLLENNNETISQNIFIKNSYSLYFIIISNVIAAIVNVLIMRYNIHRIPSGLEMGAILVFFAAIGLGIPIIIVSIVCSFIVYDNLKRIGIPILICIISIILTAIIERGICQ